MTHAAPALGRDPCVTQTVDRDRHPSRIVGLSPGRMLWVRSRTGAFAGELVRIEGSIATLRVGWPARLLAVNHRQLHATYDECLEQPAPPAGACPLQGGDA